MALLFDIKHFAVHDGDGIRTTVFFKGCPLRCAWCHNPEGLSSEVQIAHQADKCTLCGRCAAECKADVHKIGDAHTLMRDRCDGCGKCVEVCPKNALTLYGQRFDLEAVLAEVLEDRDFYSPRGGVTLSGGECLLYPDECVALLSRLKAEGIHTAVDTSGFVPRRSLSAVLPYTDQILYDIKAYDAEVHRRITGQPNDIILDNLRYLDSTNKAIEIRIPYVPTYNDGEIDAIGAFLSSLTRRHPVRLLPYHRYYESKARALGYASTRNIPIPTDEEIHKAKNILTSYGLELV